MDLAEQVQYATAVAAAIAVFVAGWSGTQTPEPPESSDALRVEE